MSCRLMWSWGWFLLLSVAITVSSIAYAQQRIITAPEHEDVLRRTATLENRQQEETHQIDINTQRLTDLESRIGKVENAMQSMADGHVVISERIARLETWLIGIFIPLILLLVDAGIRRIYEARTVLRMLGKRRQVEEVPIETGRSSLDES